MVEYQFNLLFDEIEKRWPIESVGLVHRVGVVKVNGPVAVGGICRAAPWRSICRVPVVA